MVADPSATPCTTPELVTVATAVFDVLQLTVRPGSEFPIASRVAAVSCSTVPTATTEVEGVTVTLATGLWTVIEADPLTPSALAVIVAGPSLTPVTKPAAFTAAICPSLLVQAMVRPVSEFPLASLAAAVSWTVPPGAAVLDAGVTTMLASAGGPELSPPPHAQATHAASVRQRRENRITASLLLISHRIYHLFSRGASSIFS